jgi:protein O-mannosyl-transferase
LFEVQKTRLLSSGVSFFAREASTVLRRAPDAPEYERAVESSQLSCHERAKLSAACHSRLALAGGAVILALLSLAAYLPSLHGGFILDDNYYLTDAPLIRAPDGAYRFWFTSEGFDYYPVSNTTLWLEWRLWGKHPAGYHLTNLCIHILNSLLLWAILRRLSAPGSYLAALLFAVHPVNVESVAWIAQRKGLLAMTFLLLSILWYMRDDDTRRAKRSTTSFPIGTWYWLSLLAFLFAMLSKGSVAILPLVLLLLAWWRRDRIDRGDWLRAAPFALVAIVLTAVHVHYQSRGLSEAIREATFAQRLAGAAAAVWFYLYKAIWPLDLNFVYRQWEIHAASIVWWLPLIAAVALTALLAWRRNTWWGRPLLFAWIFFCLALVPVLGFTDVGYMKYSLVADHYQYLSIVAVAALVAAAWASWYRHAKALPMRAAPLITAVGLVGTLTLLTWKDSNFYESAVTLYRATLEKNPTAWLIHNDLGAELDEIGSTQEAADCFRQALQIKPDYADAQNNLGLALQKMGRLPEATERFQEAVRLQPDDPKNQTNLALALLALGRTDEAIEHANKALPQLPLDAKLYDEVGQVFLRAGRTAQAIPLFEHSLELDPNSAQALSNLGMARAKLGQFPQAIDEFQKALQLEPDRARIHKNLALAFVKANRRQDAIQEYRQAVTLDPNDADAQAALANSLVDAGQTQEAIGHFEKVLQLKPEAASAVHNAIGVALNKAGEPKEAISHFEQALQTDPKNVEAYNNLAWILSNSSVEELRNPTRAVELATRAVELEPSSAGAFNTLGIANYRAGDWQKAIQWLDKSVQAGGGTSFDWFFLAMATEKLGRHAEAKTCYEKAVQWMQRHAPDDKELLRFRRETEDLLAHKPAVGALGHS